MKKKKYLTKEIKTDSNTKLSISTTTTSVITANGKKAGLQGLAIILTNLDGNTLESYFTETQLDEFISQLKRMQGILHERNHPSGVKCPF